MKKAFLISQNNIRILIGILFIVSAVLKLLSIDNFQLYVLSFNVFGFALTEIMVRLLIAVEMVLGVGLIMKLKYKWVWWGTTLMTVAFTLFLIYVVIFRNDENCHCFGTLIDVKPLASVFKNLLLLGALVFCYGKCHRRCFLGWMTGEDGKQHFCCRFVEENDAYWSEENYSRIFKIIFCSVVGVLIFLASFVLYPPNALYSKMFSKDNLVATDVYDMMVSDSLVRVHLVNRQYDEKRDTVTFETDTAVFIPQQGRYVVAVVSAGCKYCKQSCELVHDIFEHNDLPAESFKMLIWGQNNQHYARFMRLTKTWEHDFYCINPLLAVDMVYGSFPTFMMIKDGKIEKSFDYQRIVEGDIVKFVKSGE